MTPRREVLNKLGRIFSAVLNEQIILSELSQKDTLTGWDSLSHIELMMAVEDAFKISFSGEEIAALENIADLVTLIQKRIR